MRSPEKPVQLDAGEKLRAVPKARRSDVRGESQETRTGGLLQQKDGRVVRKNKRAVE